MALRASYSKRVFQFNFDARTSRGQMADKISWFIKIWDDKFPQFIGIGECGPLPGLSIDHRPDFENVLEQVISSLMATKEVRSQDMSWWRDIIPSGFPSITFGVETALLDLFNGGQRIIFPNNFRVGSPIPINGLIWMGDADFMLKQIDQKINQGFTCIKIKIGGLDFDHECSILQHIRKKFSAEQITLRLDANGAFDPSTAMSKLQTLSQYQIHSIEQPVKPNLSVMPELCSASPIPVALDEELIGKDTTAEKEEVLNRIRPAFIILKPTLHGGLSGCEEWIKLAVQRKIGWWITSALESNIGLNAICQFTANYPIEIPQGLGTGTIYRNNIPSPLSISNGNIFTDTDKQWKLEMI